MPFDPWRETPLVLSDALSRAAGCQIYLKLENLQPSGSFKSRGIGSYMLRRLDERRTPTDPHPSVHFYSSSGGNAGLAAVHAATALDYPCTVVVPNSTKPAVIAQMRAAGAHAVIQHGAAWRDADTYLKAEVLAKDSTGIYVPPFDHPDIWAGNGTAMTEIAKQLGERPDALLCSVGGGGLLSGVCGVLDNLGWSDVQVLAMETRGADSLARSVAAGELITMPAITSEATTLGAARVAQNALDCGLRKNVRCVVISDAEAAMGCWRLADAERTLVEMSCGVNVAMCFGGRLERALGRPVKPDDKVVIVLCGGTNVSVDQINRWRAEFGDVESRPSEMQVVDGVEEKEAPIVNGHMDGCGNELTTSLSNSFTPARLINGHA